RAQGANVAVAAHEDADVAEKAAHAANRFGPVEVEAVVAALVGDQRRGQGRGQARADGEGAGAGAARAVRAGAGVVHGGVHHVHAEVTGPRDAQDGVHVGAVEVDQGPLLVQQIGDGGDLLVEQAEGVGVGDHEDRGAVVELGAEVVEIDAAAFVALDGNGV